MKVVALTDFSDLFGSFHERGLNQVIRHVMAKRPSLFNYGTAWVAQDWEKRLCCRPEVAPEVITRSNPVVTVEQPLPVPGTNSILGLNWALQIADLAIDIHASDRELPKELGGKLAKQQLALFARVCGGIGCPSRRFLDAFPPVALDPWTVPGASNTLMRTAVVAPPRDPVTLPTEGLTCFELDLYATAHARVMGPAGAQVLEIVVDGLEIVDIEPQGLENSLECYAMTLIRFVLMPRMRVLLPVFVFNLPLGLGSVTVKAATTVPNNPAVEDDQIKLFVDMEVGP